MYGEHLRVTAEVRARAFACLWGVLSVEDFESWIWELDSDDDEASKSDLYNSIEMSAWDHFHAYDFPRSEDETFRLALAETLSHPTYRLIRDPAREVAQ